MTTEESERLARQFVDAAHRLHGERSPREVQERIVELAVATVPGCEHAAISVVRRDGTLTTAAASSELPLRVDSLQYRKGEGPCVDAIREGTLYRTGDLASETRWPAFAPEAVAATGVRSMLSFRLGIVDGGHEGDGVHGALNLYAGRPAAFDEHGTAVGVILAGHAELALSHARDRVEKENLAKALDSNREIGVAIGILMAGGVTREQAFGALRAASQALNVKLREVAAEVTHTGRLPAPPSTEKSGSGRH